MVTRQPVPSLRTEALHLVQVLGWRVVPGTYVADGVCSCHDPLCPAPGLHPALAAWETSLTRAGSQVDAWWAGEPGAGSVVAAGAESDGLDLPLLTGSAVLGSLESDPGNVGPVAVTAHGRVLMFVRPGAAAVVRSLAGVLGAAADWSPGGPLRVHGRGGPLVGPPAGPGGPAPAGRALPPLPPPRRAPEPPPAPPLLAPP